MSLRFREDRNTWEVSYTVCGKRKRKSFTKENEAGAIAFLNTIDPNAQLKFIKTPISEAIGKYYEIESKKKDSEKNEKRWLNILFHYLTLQKIEFVHQVKLLHLEELQLWLQQGQKFNSEELADIKPLNWQTVNRWFSTYGHFFKKTLQWQMTEKNPCEFLSLLDGESKIQEVWPDGAYEKIHSQCQEWFKDVFEFIYLTGARPSSIARLTWSDVNFEMRYIRLSSKKGPKRKTKYFPVPMIDRLFLLLAKHAKNNEGREIRNEAVFRGPQGGKITSKRITKSAMRAIQKAGHKGLELYGLRHKLASDLASHDVGTDKIRRILGHSDERSTLRYLTMVPSEAVSRSLAITRNNIEKGEAV